MNERIFRHQHFLAGYVLACVAFLFLLTMPACSSLGSAPADTFGKRLAGGYEAVAALADTATTLRVAGKLSDADKANVQATATAALSGLDLAAKASATDPTAAGTKLDSVLLILSSLQTYLVSKGK